MFINLEIHWNYSETHLFSSRENPLSSRNIFCMQFCGSANNFVQAASKQTSKNLRKRYLNNAFLLHTQETIAIECWDIANWQQSLSTATNQDKIEKLARFKQISKYYIRKFLCWGPNLDSPAGTQRKILISELSHVQKLDLWELTQMLSQHAIGSSEDALFSRLQKWRNKYLRNRSFYPSK